MKTKYEILDAPFNRDNYPDLIGQVVDSPPPHAHVKLVKVRESLDEIFENATLTFPTDFIKKCISEGYQQKEIIDALGNMYRMSLEESNGLFKKVILDKTGIGKNVGQLLQNKKASSDWYKKASNDSTPDFTNVDVRRLNGILLDFQDLSRDALLEMDMWLANGETNIDLEEAKIRLSYYLARLGVE